MNFTPVMLHFGFFFPQYVILSNWNFFFYTDINEHLLIAMLLKGCIVTSRQTYSFLVKISQRPLCLKKSKKQQ